MAQADECIMDKGHGRNEITDLYTSASSYSSSDAILYQVFLDPFDEMRVAESWKSPEIGWPQ